MHEEEGRTPLNNLNTGQMFLDPASRGFYLKTNGITDPGYYACVNLETGAVRYFIHDYRIVAVEFAEMTARRIDVTKVDRTGTSS